MRAWQLYVRRISKGRATSPKCISVRSEHLQLVNI